MKLFWTPVTFVGILAALTIRAPSATLGPLVGAIVCGLAFLALWNIVAERVMRTAVFAWLIAWRPRRGR